MDTLDIDMLTAGSGLLRKTTITGGILMMIKINARVRARGPMPVRARNIRIAETAASSPLSPLHLRLSITYIMDIYTRIIHSLVKTYELEHE